MTETLLPYRTVESHPIPQVDSRPLLQSRLLDVKLESRKDSIPVHILRRVGEGTLSASEAADLIEGHDLEMQKYRNW